MANIHNHRLMPTPSRYAREHLLYVQEIGTLTSQSPHISTRDNIHSYLFMIVISGSGFFTYRNEKTKIQQGDCVFIDCTEKYAHESSEEDPWTLTWVHFYGSHAKDITDYYRALNLPFLFHPADLNVIQSTLHSLYQVIESPDAMSEISANKYLTDLITFSFKESRHSDTVITLHGKLQQIRDFLVNNYMHKITLDSISSYFFISKYYLSREYKNFFGITLLNDLTNIRISNAKSLLRFSSDSVEMIAQQCGFSDSAYFIKVFKKAEKMTPFSYRQKW